MFKIEVEYDIATQALWIWFLWLLAHQMIPNLNFSVLKTTFKVFEVIRREL